AHAPDGVDQRLTELRRPLLTETLPSLDQQIVDRRVRSRKLIGRHRQAIDLVQILLGALEQTGLGSHDLQAGHREQHREQDADPREGEELRPDAQLHRAAAAPAKRTHSSAVTSPTQTKPPAPGRNTRASPSTVRRYGLLTTLRVRCVSHRAKSSLSASTWSAFVAAWRK